MDDTSMIQIESLEFSYEHNLVFQNLSYTFEKGISYAMIGRSGCGKSSLLHLIAGEKQANHGTISRNSSVLPLQNGKIGFLYQNLALFPWQTVEEAVRMPLRILNQDADEKVEVMLKELGIWGKRNAYPKDLSGGERQRVALARTLITQPKLLLMDEPTSALDQMTKEVLQHVILEEQKRHQYTLLFVTHDIEEAVFLGEKIVILHENGKLIEVLNPFFGLPDVKEQLPYYEFCIKLRQTLGMEYSYEE